MKNFLSSFLSIFLLISLPAEALDLKKMHIDKSIKTIEEYLNSTKEFSATFIQEDSSNDKREGKIFVKKPNNVRIDYYTPEKESLVVDEDYIAIYNQDLDELTYISSEGMPINFLSKDHVSLKKDLHVTNAIEQNNIISLETKIVNKNGEFIVVLGFDKNPTSLRTIRVVNADGSYVDLFVSDISYDTIQEGVFDIKRKKNR
jgi:outer membrane lipoprotein-sorting protein